MNQEPTKHTGPGIWSRFFGNVGRLRARIGPASYFYSSPRFVWRIAEKGEAAFYVWLGRRQVLRLVLVIILIAGGIWFFGRNPGS